MRQIYIIQSAHRTIEFEDPANQTSLISDGLTPEKITFVRQACRTQLKVAHHIVKRLVRLKGIDALFYDSVGNQLETLAYRGAYDSHIIETIQSENGFDGLVAADYLRLVRELTQINGTICALATEPEPILTLQSLYHYPDCMLPVIEWAIAEGKLEDGSPIAENFYRQRKRYESTHKNESAYTRAIMATYFHIRDKEIFRQITEYYGTGWERAVLFMGSAHPLLDFDSLSEGLQVTRIHIFQPSLDTFFKTGNLEGDNTVKYTCRVVNQGNVHEDIIRICETAVAQAEYS